MQDVSVKSTIAGLVIGSLVLCANFQFGLQTGWVSMMSMPASLLGFATFKALRSVLTVQENVYLQSVAVAVGTGPLAFGFVGAIPAIELLITKSEGRVKFSTLQLITWSLGISFMGIFTAKLLRKTVLLRERLKFPSGYAAANLIGVLHDKPVKDPQDDGISTLHGEPQAQLADEDVLLDPQSPDGGQTTAQSRAVYKDNVAYLSYCFLGSSVFTVLGKFYPLLRMIPIFGRHAARNLWVLDPSPAYVGQGMIMGFETTLSMFWGVILGWLVLAPLANAKGWAPGPIDDWRTGGQGWIMWISLAIMVADTSVSLFLLIFRSLQQFVRYMNHWTRLDDAETNSFERAHAAQFHGDDDEDDRKISGTQFHTRHVAALGLAVASVLCVAVTKLLFPSAPWFELIIGVLLAPIFSLLAIRALGETDLNPVSSLAKLTQLIFGIMMRNKPHAVLLNIVAGAITEAGAQQAGDLMQDFRTGQMLGASNLAQLVGMVIGTLWSVVLSALVYKLYNQVYTIPGKEFRIPTAFIWVDAARLMAGEGLPPHVGEFAAGFGVLFVVLAILRHRTGNNYIPSGVAVGVGMYSVPSFTLARFVGGILALYVSRRWPRNAAYNLRLNIASSGLILGEGVMSVLALGVSLTAAKGRV